MSSIYFEATFDTSKLRAGIKEANKTIGEWAANAQREGLVVDNTFSMLQRRVLQFASIHFARQIGNEIIKARGEFQQLGIAFETMLGSKAKADQLMQDAIIFAQKTPFTLTDVTTNIKQLMAMGIETEKVMTTMKSLGDVAAGVSVPISRIAINYGQVAALGRLQQREIRDFAMAGIPIVEELARQFGKTSAEISDMVEAGQIGFPAVEKAFASMAGEGGKFYNLMEKQNASVTGQISNLQDKIEVMLNSIGKANEGLIYGGIEGLATLVENYEDVIKVLKPLVVVLGSYKAATIAVAVYEKIQASNEAVRASIIESKVAVIKQAIAAEEAQIVAKELAAKQEAELQARESANAAARQAAAARTVAAKEASAKATADLIAAEKAYAITFARNQQLMAKGLLTSKAEALQKKELAAVETLRSNLRKKNAAVDSAISSEVAVNARIEANAVKQSEAEKIAARKAGIAASRQMQIENAKATASEIRAAKARQFFNRTMLGNPYVLATVGLIGLVTALNAFSNKAKTVEDRIEDMNNSISQIGRQQEINGLIKKYDALKEKAKLTGDEQKELNSTIQELSTIFPEAISGIDQYGKAVDVVREKLASNNKELQLFLENSTKQEISEGQKKLNELIATRDRLVKELNTGTGERSYTTGSVLGGVTTKKTVELTKSELNQNKEDLDKILEDIDGLSSKLTESQKKLLELGSITAEEALKPYKDLFKELGEYTTKELYDTKAKLTALLSEGFGSEAEAKIKQQIDSIASKLGEPTIKQQIEATTEALEEAQKKLTDFRSPNSQASVKQIEDQETAVEELVKKLESLTGFKQKASKEVEDLKKQIDQLFKDLETADEADRGIIAARILVLQQELLLREKIAETAVKGLRDQAVPVKLKPIQPNVSTDKTQSGGAKSLIDWIFVFGDLDRISTDALIDLRDKLKKYLGQIDDDISKEDFKEISDAFRAINESIEARDPFGTISDAINDLKYYSAKVELQKKIVEQKKQEGASTEEISRAERDLLAAQNGRAKSLAKITKGINQIGRDGSELVSAIREYTDMLGSFGVDIDDQGRKIIDGVGQIMNGLESIDLTKPFSIVIGSIKAVSGFGNVIASLLGGGDSELSQKTFDRYDDLMTTMDDLISKQKELLDAMAGAEAVAKSDEAVALINKQIEATRRLGLEWLNSGASWKSHSRGYNLRKSLRDFADEFNSIGIDFDSLGGRVEGLFSLGPEQLQTLKEEVPEAWARIDDQTRGYLQTIIDSGDELEGMKDQLNETLTGLSFDSAKDSLQDFLLDVDSTMADVAGNFEKYMREAIVGTLIDGPLKVKIQEWYSDFAKAMDDGILEDSEKEKLRRMYEGIFKEGQSLRDMAFSAAGLDFGSDAATHSGMSGAIRREMTEETAGELAGIWRKTSDDIRQTKDYTKQAINHLVAIEANTHNTVIELQNAVTELKGSNSKLEQIVGNTKPSQTGRDLGL